MGKAGSGWEELQVELDAWQNAGKRATLWWRDDDSSLVMTELHWLLELSKALEIPLCLAAIPAAASPALAREAARYPMVSVAVHGHAHANHAGLGGKKAEFGAHRPVAEMVPELAHGLERAREIFGTLLRPVFVPPWNRIAAALVATLPGIGFSGLSTFGPRKNPRPVTGLPQVNSHVEATDWKTGGGPVTADAIMAGIAAHLRARRRNEADAAEPTGLLTHHQRMQERDFVSLREVIGAIRSHPAARWLTLDEALSST